MANKRVERVAKTRKTRVMVRKVPRKRAALRRGAALERNRVRALERKVLDPKDPKVPRKRKRKSKS